MFFHRLLFVALFLSNVLAGSSFANCKQAVKGDYRKDFAEEVLFESAQLRGEFLDKFLRLEMVPEYRETLYQAYNKHVNSIKSGGGRVLRSTKIFSRQEGIGSYTYTIWFLLDTMIDAKSMENLESDHQRILRAQSIYNEIRGLSGTAWHDIPAAMFVPFTHFLRGYIGSPANMLESDRQDWLKLRKQIVQDSTFEDDKKSRVLGSAVLKSEFNEKAIEVARSQFEQKFSSAE